MADGELTAGDPIGRNRRRLAHGLVVAVAVLVTAVMVGLTGSVRSAGLAGPAGLVGSTAPSGPGMTEPFSPHELDRLRSLASEAVVRITGEGCGTDAVGTGFAVDGIVVTNQHLVDGAGSARVDAPASPVAPAVVAVLGASAVVDLAQLERDLPVNRFALTELAVAAPAVGERVLLAGYGGGQDLRFVEASVHLVVPGDAYGVDGEVVLIDGFGGPGFSGGPVVNRQGAAVAVLKGIDEATGLTVAISTAMLSEAPWPTKIEQEERACK